MSGSGLYGDLPEENNSQGAAPIIAQGGWAKLNNASSTAAAAASKPASNMMSFKPRQALVSTSTTVAAAAPSSSSSSSSGEKAGGISIAFKPRQTASAGSAKPSVASSAALGYTESVVTKRDADAAATTSSYSLSDHLDANLRHQGPRDPSHTLADDGPTAGAAAATTATASFEVDDPYDPARPNDYLLYCEERLERRRALELEEENARKFAEIERAREQLERDRADAVQSGDMQRLLGSAGRGRGRGLSNLPSWVTQMQATEGASHGSSSSGSSGSGSGNGRGAPGQFDDSGGEPSSDPGGPRKKQALYTTPSTVLLLENMVAPGTVDSELAGETKQECERFGPVASCVAFEEPLGGAVRLFVVFHAQESAVRAFRDLNGRFFAGRQVAASFFDEDKFARRQLSCED